ncbi:MAG: rhodanese-like domain-containing protein [Gammaproteobacteria bacterium]|nr:rhodanese-like domain-containing protein [Gammaproteobacteria bacterium]MDH5693110.1 rhodanese-like domain-containing protein [Gammaproteobacteria bacterium]
MSKIKSLTAKEAMALLEKTPSAVLIDVRSSMEFIFVGHPLNAINIPWIDEPDWKVNPNFVKEVRRVMLGGATCTEEGCAPILLICRSGRRSMEAGELLVEEGFAEVFNIEGGFEGPLDEKHHRSTVAGWRYDGLPWEQC